MLDLLRHLPDALWGALGGVLLGGMARAALVRRWRIGRVTRQSRAIVGALIGQAAAHPPPTLDTRPIPPLDLDTPPYWAKRAGCYPLDTVIADAETALRTTRPDNGPKVEEEY